MSQLTLLGKKEKCDECGGSGVVLRKRVQGEVAVPCPLCRSELSDPDRPTKTNVRGPIASHLAALDAYPRSGSWQEKALGAFIEAGERGLTDYELAVRLGRAHMRGSVAKYRGALLKGGWVSDTIHMRVTDTGSKAIVWRLSERASRELAKRRRRRAG